VSFYVSTATFFLLHCDEWDRVVALPRHKFVTGATLLQLPTNPHLAFITTTSTQNKKQTHTGGGLNRQIWYRHLNSEAGNDEIQNFQRGDFYFVGITF